MSSYFEGRLALVTGASSGIGRALCLELSRLGASLAMVSRDPGRLALGLPGSEAFACDLARLEGIDALVRQVEARCGRSPEILIHCAARSAVGRLEDVPPEDLMGCLAVNLASAFLLSRSLLPAMKRAGFGHLVFFSSGAAHHGVPTEIAYGASKSGIERLAEGLRLECSGSGVQATIVSPGPVETPLLRSTPAFGAARPLSRPARAAAPAEVAAAVAGGLPSRPDLIELSWKPRAARWLGRWAPWALRRALAIEMRREGL
jgi:NAD(P)-dependent dehydrogenase (short-subunit alcohol dehydrogenase family)